MVEKRKLSYKNFNICKLIREGKLKLQYPENLNESKKQYKKINKRINKINLYKIPSKIETFDNSILDFLPEMNRKIEELLGFIDYFYLKEYGKLVEFENEITKEKKWFIMFFKNEQNLNEKFLGYNIQIEDIEPYLINFDMVKTKYLEEELKEILIKYVELKRNEINNKELIKK